ncbi:hypothetical protein BC830DRAFT_1098817 [Chytriomyces sp. MP71]|nr:hypothetical protein BC830DRAFT_1098817 [Chytriomyces sp. MP71]
MVEGEAQSPLDAFHQLAEEATSIVAFLSSSDLVFAEETGFAMDGYLRKRREVADSLRGTAAHVEAVVRNTGLARSTGGGLAVASGVAVIGGVLAAPFTMGLSLGLTIGGLSGGVASAATTASAALVKNSSLKTNADRVAALLKELQPMDEIVFALLTRMNELAARMQNLAEYAPEVAAFLKDDEKVVLWLNSVGDHLSYHGHRVALTPRSVLFVKGLAEFVNADFALVVGLAAGGMAAPGLAIPFTQTIIVAAGGTAATLLSSSLAMFGIGFGIWDIHAGVQDFHWSEHAQAYRSTADQMEVQTKQIVDMLGN